MFELTEDQQAIVDAVNRVCAAYGDDYWLARDADGVFPDAFVADIAIATTANVSTP